MQTRGGFGHLINDARALVPRGAAAVWLALGAVLLLQAAFWYLGSPGPTLLDAAPRTPGTAILAVGWAAALLLLAPMAIWSALGRPLGTLGWRIGAWRLGLPVTAGLAVIAAPLLWLGAAAPAIQTTYPWPGAWAGASPGRLAAWAGIFVIYYIAFEFFYRGFLLRFFEALWGLRAAIWLQALCATLVHLGKPWPETLIAFPASLLLALIAVRTRSLLWPILLHFAVGMTTDIASLSRQGWLLP